MKMNQILLHSTVALMMTLGACGNSTMAPSPDAGDMAGGTQPDAGCSGTSCTCACPGQGLANADVTCGQDMGLTCQLTCRGENYDVDNNPSNGCEQKHDVPPGHSQAEAGVRNHLDCYDSSTDNIFGFLMADSRTHTNPTVGSFNVVVGSAPDFFRVPADGGTLCENDYDITFGTSGGSSTGGPCYKLTIITDKMTQSVTATGSDLVHMSSGSSSYSGGTDIYLKVEKICSLPQQEEIRYSIMYHL